MVRIYELQTGERFVWNGAIYSRGEGVTLKGRSTFYLCLAEGCDVPRPFAANLEVERL